MTICTSSIPHPPPIPSSTRGSTKGFRLMDPSLNDPVETGSVYSIYKQKIDSMFESDSSGASNTVQARIERMFTEVAKDEGLPPKIDPGCHGFSVDYLGSVPLQGKVTSLAGLQEPLRELYFSYKRKNREKSMTGRLEISQTGLRVLYQGEKGDLEQHNPFPTIAVWSAVKFVLRTSPNTYAFLPLITDPDNIDKQQLFKTLDEPDEKYILNQTHAPLFAVVMRKIGVHKQLECHGFACQTSEDAIVIAATLYKSLMSHMKNKDKKPKNKNGLGCMSMTSSIYNESGGVPVRPPRKKRSTASSVVSENEIEVDKSKPTRKSTKSRRAPTIPPPKKGHEAVDMDEILPYEEPDEVPREEASPVDGELKRSRSLSRTASGVDNSGDILTKVTIPRSGSFLNAGGLTRYKSKVNRTGPNGQASGGSPLGFHELFNEFRLQEGLHSMDEILGVIIDSEGMSFNDLKPIYKEFLLKLAVTLTKDELYQRSKSIMRRQKKKILRKNSRAQKNRRKIIVGAKGLKRVFRKSFRVNLGKRLYGKKVGSGKFDVKKVSKQESSISTSSYDTRQFRPKIPEQGTRKQSYRKRKDANMRMRRERMSTSEDSDFFTLKRSKSKTSPSNQNRNSSSGYVSCSECSYDSDTCTCVSADKCYCSLGNRFERKAKKMPDAFCYCQDTQRLDMSWCGCDTDSCTDSNKCYCQNFIQKGTIFEQLKRRGFIPTRPEVVTPPNPRKLAKKLSNTRSTRSVEYVSNPAEKLYRQKLPKDLLLPRAFSEQPTRSSSHSIRSFKSYSGRPKTLQATVPAESSTEALSVKKSAEIAALFADVKLSQTTDITHLAPYRPTKIVTPYKGSKMVQNALYASRSSKNSLYSAKNGLYTIQSQSDSSCSEKHHLSLDPTGGKPKRGVSGLENTLGYLP